MSARPPGVPPGRAGRLWLRRRLEVASGAVDLLNRKLHLLRRERDRIAAEAQDAARQWRASCASAERWSLRAAVLAGEDALRPAVSGGRAEVTVTTTAFMGVRFPSAVRLAEPPGPVPDAAAARRAAAECRTALSAAAGCAATSAALRILDAEIDTTRRRVRAVETRWIPRLSRALAEIELGLEEEEHADGVRMRRFRGDGRPTTGPTSATSR